MPSFKGAEEGAQFLLKLLGKGNILSGGDPVTGFVVVTLPAYRQAGAPAKIGSPCLRRAGTEGIPY